MHLDLYTGLLLALVGLVAGYVDGMAGGGGLMTVPVLLSVGIPPHFVLGTNKLAATMGVSQSARAFIRKKIFQPRLWLAAILAAVIGSLAGAVLVQFIHADFLAKLIPAVMIVVIIYVAFPKHPHRYQRKPDFKPKALPSAVLTGTVGFYDGFLGPGTGTILTALVMAVFKVELIQASGVAKFMNFLSNFAALITFIIMRHVIYSVGIIMGVTYMIGSHLGAHTAIRFGSRYIKPVFLLIAVVICVRLIWVEWL